MPDSDVRLDEVRPVLDVYFRAMAGRRAQLQPYGDSDDPRQFPDTWTTVRLPPSVAAFGSRQANLDWYKVALAHRSAHYECGSFQFSFDREAACFSRLRPHSDAVQRQEPETDLERFLRLFARRRLAFEVFCVLEDLRLDSDARRRYAGLRGALAAVQHHELGIRPSLDGLAPRAALGELLVRLSLGAAGPFPVPPILHEPVRQLAQITRAVADPAATVEDAAEATLRAYALLARLPNMVATEAPAPVDANVAPFSAAAWPTAWPEAGRVRLEGDAILETVLEPVGYRDGLGSRFTSYRSAGPLDVEAIYRLPRSQPDDAVTGSESGEAADSDERDRAVAPVPEPLPHEHPEQGEHDPSQPVNGHLHSDGPDSFTYPEYDHIAGGYRDAWCLLRELRPDADHTTGFYSETLASYGHLLPDIRRELERFAPEGLRAVRRSPDGDDIDLEAAIEALTDLLAGLGPSDSVYVQTERSRRDVAVALLLDMSSSTAERVEPPQAQAAAMDRGRGYRRIIDIERESAALLMAALEQVGDSCGVYGFSGSGRADVRFLVIKEPQERLSNSVIARLEAVKPVHTTRMAPAIRHATAKLRRQPERTKLLMLVSDGRPFDIDYGSEYGEGAEVDYALHDTRWALDEAQRAGVRTCLLTVDEQGADYLRDMSSDLDYEVLADTNLLPERLLRLYRQLSQGPQVTSGRRVDRSASKWSDDRTAGTAPGKFRPGADDVGWN
ncbi:MAG: hypothetical protein M3387_09770 [Actinomycetota bacterium]|nr:hypothetical protein [Actinomycetota bacterium]